MVPGVLDFNLKLKTLQQIGPSRYSGLKACALREVWSAAKQPGLLPVAPATRVGTVIHTLLEEAGVGHFLPGDRDSIKRHWEDLVSTIQNEMDKSWLEKHFVPLEDSYDLFEVRRFQAITRAAELANTRQINNQVGTREVPSSKTELKLESKDGLVTGRIDRVFLSKDGPVLQDYKSGPIFEENQGSGASRKIKPNYEMQLKLYAALYAQNLGIWPVRLELLSLDGGSVAVGYEREICTRLLEDAAVLLKRVNNAITSSQTSGEAEKELAQPSEINCAWCPFRPTCHPYREARATAPEPANGWPIDLWGTVDSISLQGNKRLSLVVRTSDPVKQTSNISNLNPDQERHPALYQLKSGDQVALYNLKLGGAFGESKFTTIYKIVERTGTL